MSTTGRTEEAAAVADRLAEADFARIVGSATGDGLAATSLLASAAAAVGAGYQASVGHLGTTAERTTDADLTVALDRPDVAADCHLDAATRPASAAAAAVADDCGATVDPALALAGVVAGGGTAADLPVETDLERRPGLAVPTADPVDGLAHSTLVVGPFSGDAEQAAELLAGATGEDPDADERRRRASLVALAVCGADASERAGTAVECALRPHVGGPLETVEGYADVLDAVARERPGLGLALAHGADVRTEALDAWRAHASAAHAALGRASPARYDGCYALTLAEGPRATVARLAAAYRSPEPYVVVAGPTAAAVCRRGDVDGDVGRLAAEAVADEPTVSVAGTTRRARLRYDDGDRDRVLEQVVEAVP